MPSLYPEKSLTWEAWIYNAFDEAGIDIHLKLTSQNILN
jgi:hypothetical protein